MAHFIHCWWACKLENHRAVSPKAAALHCRRLCSPPGADSAWRYVYLSWLEAGMPLPLDGQRPGVLLGTLQPTRRPPQQRDPSPQSPRCRGWHMRLLHDSAILLLGVHTPGKSCTCPSKTSTRTLVAAVSIKVPNWKQSKSPLIG